MWEYKNGQALITTNFDLEHAGQPRITLWAHSPEHDHDGYWGGVGAFIYLPLKALKEFYEELGKYIEYMERKKK